MEVNQISGSESPVSDDSVSEEELQEKAFEMVAMLFLTDEVMDAIRDNDDE
ncbi:hypothetical protein [Sulfitobacter sp. 20_GPM-1509m]|uniref:hypothetical protein n=1 Tax=Sulfitobacter sp. 20_GPM-1509m TaxID=1380367 RepID=UPI0012DC66AD|nr:hypothetical protein [Sulfitobacter sp. 20_GPM-1509m]